MAAADITMGFLDVYTAEVHLVLIIPDKMP